MPVLDVFCSKINRKNLINKKNYPYLVLTASSLQGDKAKWREIGINISCPNPITPEGTLWEINFAQYLSRSRDLPVNLSMCLASILPKLIQKF